MNIMLVYYFSSRLSHNLPGICLMSILALPMKPMEMKKIMTRPMGCGMGKIFSRVKFIIGRILYVFKQ